MEAGLLKAIKVIPSSAWAAWGLAPWPLKLKSWGLKLCMAPTHSKVRL